MNILLPQQTSNSKSTAVKSERNGCCNIYSMTPMLMGEATEKGNTAHSLIS